MKTHCVYLSIISLAATVSLAQQYTGEIILPTVHIARDYGKQLTEHPTPDTSDWKNVKFNNYFYQRRHPKTLEDIKHYLKFGDIMEKSLLKQLQKTISMRHDAGLQGHFVRVLHPEPGSRFVIISNLNGAFHTLTRILEYLNRHGNIEDNFVLDPRYYLVFDGNIFSDSAYGLDTLVLLLRLIEQNPDKVFCISGYYEEKERWKKTNFASELDIRSRSSTPQKNIDLIGQFFDTFPLALYLVDTDTDKEINLVRIGALQLEERTFDEKLVASLFANKALSIIHLQEQTSKHTTLPVHIHAIIQGTDDPSHIRQGLTSVKKDNVITWNTQAGSTGPLQVINHYLYESCIILETASNFNDWTITLLSRHVRKMKMLEPVKRYNLISGNELDDSYIKKFMRLRQKEQQRILAENLTITDKKIEQLQEKIKSYSHNQAIY